MPKNYSDKEFKKDLKELAKLIHDNNKKISGGAKPLKTMKKTIKKRVIKNNEKRHFRVVEINGKAVSIGDIYVKKNTGTPSSAAKKALRTCCAHLKIKGDKKVNCSVKFCIQEVTQGSKKKIYGPYKGSYKKIPKNEQVELPGGIVREFKPVVKLV